MNVNQVNHKPTLSSFVGPAVITLVASVVLYLLFSAWVNVRFLGKPWGPLDLGARWQLPPALGERGWYPTSKLGSDGQFYYYDALDPLLTGKVWRSLDNPRYRYQRIGAPILAWGAGRLRSQGPVSPRLYFAILFLIVAAGFSVAFSWLRARGVPGWYALGWMASPLVFPALAIGVPDAAADAWLILALVCALEGALLPYVAAASWMVLTRETQLLFPLSVTGMTLLGRLPWCSRLGKWTVAPATLVPLLVAPLWGAYVASRVPAVPVDLSTLGLFDWPLVGHLKAMLELWHGQDSQRLRETFVLGIASASVVAYFAWRHRRETLVQLFALYLVFLACLGKSTWLGDISAKATGAALVLGIFLLPRERSRWLRAVLVLNLLWGLVAIERYYVLPRWQVGAYRWTDPPPPPRSFDLQRE